MVTVHSDIRGGKAARSVAADSQPRIHLLPAGEGLKVAVLSRPFGQLALLPAWKGWGNSDCRD
ncbi:MAG UNVERIFIED_CONTAM: hypothetical protein LVR29_09855 [Microcystis novacekii LVE1205-3]|jgi:hypothetical protein